VVMVRFSIHGTHLLRYATPLSYTATDVSNRQSEESM